MFNRNRFILLISGVVIVSFLTAEETFLHKIIDSLTIDNFKSMISTNKNIVNQQDNAGNTILHLLARKPSPTSAQMIVFLLDNTNINKDVRNSSGKTALQLVQEYFVEPSYYDEAYWMSKQPGFDIDRIGMSGGGRVLRESEEREKREKRAKEQIVQALSA